MQDLISYRKSGADRWVQAISQAFGPSVKETTFIDGLDHAIHVLKPFVGEGINHAFLPTGGGLDIDGVEKASEQGLLYLSGGGLGQVLKPGTIKFEYVSDSPLDSFFLISLEQIAPVETNSKTPATEMSQELLLLPDGSYHDRWPVEVGNIGHDEAGDEIPVPSDWRLVSRWSAGQILIVSKFGAWNDDLATYDGRHNLMTASKIRSALLSYRR